VSLKIKATSFISSLIVLSVLMTACEIQIGNRKNKDDEEEKTLPPVIVQTVNKGSISSTLRLNSTAKPIKEVRLYSYSIGLVSEVLTEEGSFVNQNQVLVRLDNTDQSLAVERAESTLSRAKYDLDRGEELYKNHLLSENELRQFQLVLRENEINLAQARVNLERCAIKAPFAGTITERFIVAGDKVDPSRSLLNLVDQSSLILEVWVSETVAATLQLGTNGKVVPFSSSSKNSIYATLLRLSPVIDPQFGKRKATFDLGDYSPMLKPGQFVDVFLTLETHTDVVVIPKRAIVYQAGSPVVFVCNDSVAVRRAIKTDLETGDRIEILDGINIGEFIIVEGQSTLKDSTFVNVLTPDR